MFQVQNSSLNGSNSINVHEKCVFHMVTCGFLSGVINFAQSLRRSAYCVCGCANCV